MEIVCVYAPAYPTAQTNHARLGLVLRHGGGVAACLSSFCASSKVAHWSRCPAHDSEVVSPHAQPHAHEAGEAGGLKTAGERRDRLVAGRWEMAMGDA
jgi:hypothetical protein